MCSSRETIHKIFGRFRNFVLSLLSIRASIFLHVKAPEHGGCGPLLRASARRGCSLGDLAEPSGSLVRTNCSGLGGSLGFLPFLRCRSSGRKLRGQRPSGRRPTGCGAPFGESGRPGGTRQSRSGGGGLLRELSVRHRKPGCPADPGFRMGGAGRSSILHFPAMATPLPRVGERPVRDRAAASGQLHRGLAGQGSFPRGQLRRPGRQPRQRRLSVRLWDRRCALRHRLCGRRPLGVPARAPERPLRPAARLRLCRGMRGSEAGEWIRESDRSCRVSSLPSGRSAISLRFIGHARPGIRARRLMKD